MLMIIITVESAMTMIVTISTTTIAAATVTATTVIMHILRTLYYNSTKITIIITSIPSVTMVTRAMTV